MIADSSKPNKLRNVYAIRSTTKSLNNRRSKFTIRINVELKVRNIEMQKTMSKKQWIAIILSASVCSAGIVFYDVGFSFSLGTKHPYYYNNCRPSQRVTYTIGFSLRNSEENRQNPNKKICMVLEIFYMPFDKAGNQQHFTDRN